MSRMGTKSQAMKTEMETKPKTNFLKPLTCEKGLYWVLTENAPGMRNQALGLAEAMGASRIVCHRIVLRGLWNWLVPYFRLGWSDTQQQFQPPWPEVIVACGRKAIAPALWLKRNIGTLVVYVQDPYISPRYFDAVVAPAHDRMRDESIIPMMGACHRITEQKLREAREAFADSLGQAHQPRRSLFVGGPNRCFSMPLPLIESLVSHLKREEGTLWVTTSRRTPPDIVSMLRRQTGIMLITPDDTPNPYMGLLAWSDVCILTCDSVGMVSEVMAAGVPMYLVTLPGGNHKFTLFHQDAEKQGFLRWWSADIPTHPYPIQPLCEMERVAALVRERLRRVIN